MFNNNNDNSRESNNQEFTQSRNIEQNSSTSSMNMNVISERSEIIGTLKSRRNIRIAGKVDGGVEAEGKVIISSTGHIDGSIHSEEAEIAGHVVGDVHISGKLTLESSAIVESDLYVGSLCVEDGATYNGTCHMESEAEKEENDWSSNGEDDFSYNGNNDEEDGEELFDEESDEIVN